MKLTLKHASGSYDIIIERGLLSRAASELPREGKTLLVTDSGVPEAYSHAVAAACPDTTVVTIPAGEASKCFDTYRALLSRMCEVGLCRRDRVIAVGGGVCGDLAGFAAATYMRGIDFYNVPTTLLSQVDSSIGGKTAIDLDGIKNIVGAFYQPKKVLIDPDTLDTLCHRQFAAGLCEVIKTALTLDAELFRLIERSEDVRADADKIILRSLELKRSIVEADPLEKGLRRVLNFGHTIGHAVETAAGGNLLHGECVGLGMLPMCSDEVRERLRALLARFELPLSLPADIDPDRLCELIARDKKTTGKTVCAVLVDRAGEYRFEHITPARLAERAKTLRTI